MPALKADWPGDPNVHHARLQFVLMNPRGEIETEESLRFLFPVADGQEIDQMTLPDVKP
jgi:hypothetical protein